MFVWLVFIQIYCVNKVLKFKQVILLFDLYEQLTTAVYLNNYTLWHDLSPSFAKPQTVT